MYDVVLKYLLTLTVFRCSYAADMSWIQQSCSAMDSYLMVNVESQQLTIPSTQALFPPHTYYIPFIPIAMLSYIDNPCDASQINTDITNKMVILYTSNACSDHYQTYVAQQNGAIAVVISSNSNTQNSITGTNDLNTSIPVRGITRDIADIISRHVLDLGNNVTATFACDATEHPITICAVDKTDGDNWYLDGEYIRDFDQSINSHPVWHKYGFYILDYYIFLHTANRSTEWFWAITADRTFTYDVSIRAYCSVAGDDIKEPSDCPLWRTTNGTNLGQLKQYGAQPNLTVSAQDCIWEDRYVCVKSTQSTLAGLQGTYRLNHDSRALWFREMDECDATPGMIRTDDDGSLIIWDTFDDWTVARCNGSIEDSFVAFTPQTCTRWKSLTDRSLDNTQMRHDATLSITMDKCAEDECAIHEEPADGICLSNNTVLHSFLEGTYIKTGVVGADLQYVEYVKAEPLLDEDGSEIKSYLWYYGEFTEQLSWWILTPQNLTFALENDAYGVGYYGYTACSVQNVVNCVAPWNFYWGVTGASHSDASFVITEGDCPTSAAQLVPDYGDEYNYICVDIADQDAFESQTELEYDQFRGAYEMKWDERNMPYWVKPINDYTETTSYIYYEATYRYWRIDISLYDEDDITPTGMICMSNVLYPNECDLWYDNINGRVLNNVFELGIEGCSYDDLLERSCSAMHSWLQISGYISQTLTSSQTLFAPYFYRTKATQIVRLDASENPCDIDAISTDVSDKMVLLLTSSLFTSDISCSDHYQLWIMEQLGAAAVIMSSRDNTIEAIPDDDAYAITTTIPMRGISLYKADDLIAVLENGHKIYGSFNCNDSFQYPLTICASQVGLNIYGNFQYQTELKYNAHPVYLREGYSVYTGYKNTYLYLHNGDGDTLWYWAITLDEDMSDDDEIIAYCELEDDDTAIAPTDCTQWKVLQINESKSEEIEWLSSEMLTSSGLCNVSDNYFCITSEESSLAGLQGTYRLYYDDEAVWFRERDACDDNPAIFAYSDGEFYLLDPMDDWIVASCSIGDKLAWMNDDLWSEYEAHFAFHPELCTVWYTLDDNTLDDQQSYDNSLFINPVCDNIAVEECEESEIAPDTLCMTQNSVMHSFLEGEYKASGVIGDVYKTKEYARSEALYYDGENVDAYLWFYGEVAGKSLWWIISSHNMSVGLNKGYGIAFAYVACSLLNPADCRAPWNFYYASKPGKGNWHSDAQFSLTTDECQQAESLSANYSNQYEYLCIDILDDEYNGSHIFKGAYKINKTATLFSGDTPFWVKPRNNLYDEEIYIYYDEFYGYWQIGRSLHIDTLLVCMSDTQYPELCAKWYDDLNNVMTSKLMLRSEDCSKKDILSYTPKTHDGALIALVVIVIIIILFGVCGAAYWCYQKCVDSDRRDSNKRDIADGYSSTNVKSTEMMKKHAYKKKKKKKKKKHGHTQLAIGSDDDEEDGALTGGVTHGYDMRPLEGDKDDSSSAATSDDDDDDSTLDVGRETNQDEDQQQNDIHDEEDGMLIN